MKRILIATLSALLLIAPAAPTQAQTPVAKKNVGITGMWLGTASGFENGVYKSTRVRYTFTQVDGVSLTGVRSWLKTDGTWSEPQTFQGVLYKSGDFYAADNDGYSFGKRISPIKIRSTYLEAGEDQSAFHEVITKASRQSDRPAQ
jgi:hypothetical protein